MPEGLSQLLVGYDGSPSSDAAASFALWLTRATGCATTLLHVTVSPAAAPSADVLLAARDHVVSDRKAWKRRLDNLRDYAPPEAPIECRVTAGSPAEALIDVAAATAADLVLVGSHGVGRVRGALLGSVSSRLLSHAPCSVMIFDERAEPPPASRVRSVVVGVDGSAASSGAVRLAGDLARPLGATLVVVHAGDPAHPGKADAVLRDVRPLAAPAEVPVEEERLEGAVPECLVAACERHAPALLVIGRHPHGGLKQRLLGGTSWAVASQAPCPVVVSRASPPGE